MQRHRNILYALVFILLVLQMVSFVSMSSKVSQLDGQLAATQRQLSATSQELSESMKAYEAQTQRNFNDVTASLSVLTTQVSQQNQESSSLQEEIKLLKSSKGDFSGVIEDAVKSVVTVRTDHSLGTGFIVDERGYVVTNFHVIAGARRLAISTAERQLLQAQFIGADRFRDLALLKIEGNYRALQLADSDKLQVGNKVVAIGNPLGLSFTVTEGIISALERVGPNGLAEYIQTDVSLNPGNSGGPLINTQGRVVGINNFKIGNAESLGFALESNVLKEALAEMSNSTIVLARA